MTKTSLFIFLLFILYSCTENKQETDLKYYLSDFNQNIETFEKKIVVIISLNGCHTCIDQTIADLNKVSDKSKLLVIIPAYDRVMYNHYKEELKGITCIRDKKERVNDYENLLLNSNPMLYFVRNSKIVKTINYDFNFGTKKLEKEIANFLLEKN